MKTPLGTEVNVGAGHNVLDGFPALRGRGTAPPILGTCLLWPRSPISATAELLYKRSPKSKSKLKQNRNVFTMTFKNSVCGNTERVFFCWTNAFWATACEAVRPILSDRCLCLTVPSCLSVCNVRVLWPNGWTDQDETWHAGRPRPRPHCVR